MTIFSAKNTRLGLIVCSLAASLFLARSAQAQQGEGTLTGTITDAATKKPVADVVVTATSPNLQGEQIVVTDSSGFYRIPNLPPGVYTLRFDKEAFKPLAREGIELRSETTMRLNVELLPEALQAEEVVVVARNPTVDVGSSSTGANLNAEFTRRIPVSAPGGKGSASRSFESVAEAAAGANTDDFGTTINGASSPENSYIIDGLSTNNPGFGISGTPLSSEFVGEINVITGGYLPEYGRSTGGVLSVITKSGTNEFHGGAYLNYSPGALEGSRHAVPREGVSVLFQPKLRYEGDIGADIGGPIIKDKLWFYGGLNVSKTAYDIRRSVNRIHIDPVTNMPAMDSNGFTQTDEVPGNTTHYDAQLQTIQALGKLTYALNPSHRFTLTFMTLPASSGGTGQFGIDPRSGQPEVDTGSNGGTVQSLGHRFATTPYDATLRWTAESPKKNVTVESLVGWHRQSESLLPSDGSPIGSTSQLSSQPTIQWTQPVHNVSDLDPGLRNALMCQDTVRDPMTGMITIRNLCPISQYNSNGPGQLDKQSYDRYQLSSTLTYLFPWLGHHIAKVGFSLELTDYAHTKSFSGGVSYLENDDGTIGDQARFGYLSAPDVPVSLDGRTLHTKSFIGGGFVQDSWSIVDKFTLNLGVRYDTQALYSDGGQLGLLLPNQWSPRLGAIYDPTQSGRSKIFVNYAKYYENVPLDLADVALSGEPHTLAVYDSPCTSSQIVMDPKRCLNQPTVQNGVTNPNQKFNAFGAGASPIDPDLKPQSQHEIVAGADYEVLTDARVGLTYTRRWMGDVVEDMSRDGRQTFFLGNPGEGVASDFPKARRDYDAVTLQFVKNFRNNWLGQASYTWSHLRGNMGGLISQDGVIIPNHTPDFDTKSLTINRDGDLPNDHRHSLKVFGAKEWVVAARSHISGGLALRATSGAPSTALGVDATASDYGPGFAFLQPRGTGPRLPWTYSADVRAGYTFFINKNQALSVTVDVFNFLNLQQPTTIEENYTTNAVTLPPKGGKLSEAVYADGPDAGKPVKQDVANYGNPTAYSSPRTFRFGARWTF